LIGAIAELRFKLLSPAALPVLLPLPKPPASASPAKKEEKKPVSVKPTRRLDFLNGDHSNRKEDSSFETLLDSKKGVKTSTKAEKEENNDEDEIQTLKALNFYTSKAKTPTPTPSKTPTSTPTKQTPRTVPPTTPTAVTATPKKTPIVVIKKETPTPKKLTQHSSTTLSTATKAKEQSKPATPNKSSPSVASTKSKGVPVKSAVPSKPIAR